MIGVAGSLWQAEQEEQSQRKKHKRKAPAAMPLSQYSLDFGQTVKFGPTKCKTCGMEYTQSQPDDEAAHKPSVSSSSGVAAVQAQVPPWQQKCARSPYREARSESPMRLDVDLLVTVQCGHRNLAAGKFCCEYRRNLVGQASATDYAAPAAG